MTRVNFFCPKNKIVMKIIIIFFSFLLFTLVPTCSREANQRTSSSTNSNKISEIDKIIPKEYDVISPHKKTAVRGARIGEICCRENESCLLYTSPSPRDS